MRRGARPCGLAPLAAFDKRRGMSVEVERKHDVDLRPAMDRRRVVVDRRRGDVDRRRLVVIGLVVNWRLVVVTLAVIVAVMMLAVLVTVPAAFAFAGFLVVVRHRRRGRE